MSSKTSASRFGVLLVPLSFGSIVSEFEDDGGINRFVILQRKLEFIVTNVDQFPYLAVRQSASWSIACENGSGL
jgi:hypothetical protein